MAAPTTGRDYDPCEPLPVGFGLNQFHICLVHGGYYSPQNAQCQTHDVLDDVRAERARQYARYGTNADLEDGTGPDTLWLTPVALEEATRIQENLRVDYEVHEDHHGKPTWMHLVREEVAEAFAETDPAELRAELIQVAALCVSWVEKIDARGWNL